MKDKPKYLVHCFVVFVLVSTCPALKAQSCLDSKVDFSKEHPINVVGSPYTIDAKKMEENRDLFVTHFKWPNTACTTDPLAVNAADVVNDLYSVSNEIINDSKSGCVKGNYISGMWIIIGMTNGLPSYFFQPAVLKTSVDTRRKKIVFGKVINSKKVFAYAYKKFVPVTNGELKKGQKEYIDSIRIKHHRRRGVEEPGRFHDSVTWKGDSRKVFYSFQEILGFYSSQNPDEEGIKSTNQKSGDNLNEGEKKYYCRNIYINSSAGLFRKNVFKFWRIKHNTFITVETKEKTRDETKAMGESASGTDLAHVCPSNCDNLTYPTSTTKKELEKANKR